MKADYGMPYPEEPTANWLLVSIVMVGVVLALCIVIIGRSPVANESPLPEYKMEPQTTITARP